VSSCVGRYDAGQTAEEREEPLRRR
jgi:hypothetical protein